jgi:hypothetical protein
VGVDVPSICNIFTPIFIFFVFLSTVCFLAFQHLFSIIMSTNTKTSVSTISCICAVGASFIFGGCAYFGLRKVRKVRTTLVVDDIIAGATLHDTKHGILLHPVYGMYYRNDTANTELSTFARPSNNKKLFDPEVGILYHPQHGLYFRDAAAFDVKSKTFDDGMWRSADYRFQENAETPMVAWAPGGILTERCTSHK